MRNKNDKEVWKLWDAIFTSGLLSFIKDGHEAQNDDKKFKQMLFHLLICIILTVTIWGIGFWLVN